MGIGLVTSDGSGLSSFPAPACFLCRKKFFVLNLDVREAIKKKGLLLDLLYYQVRLQFLRLA